MNYSSRFFLYGPLALFLLIALGVSVIWWREAGALSRRLDALNGHEAMPGVTLRFASKIVGGFPFNIDVVFKDFRVEIKTPHGPSSWRAENFALHGLTYGREQLIFEAAGQQVVTWTDLQGHAHAMPFQAGELHASAIEGEHGLARFDLDCIGFGSPALTAARAQLHARIAPGGSAIDIAAAADAVHLSPRLASLFGDNVKEVRLNASATPARAFDGLRAGRSDWVSALEGWRKANGALGINDLEIRWDKISAMGKGSLGLDDKHTVTGLLDFKLAGMEQLVARAQQRGVHGDSFRGIAAALLDRAGKAGNNDAGLLGAVVEFRTGIVVVGGEPATTEEQLY
jgi:hypothetical protein